MLLLAIILIIFLIYYFNAPAKCHARTPTEPAFSAGNGTIVTINIIPPEVNRENPDDCFTEHMDAIPFGLPHYIYPDGSSGSEEWGNTRSAVTASIGRPRAMITDDFASYNELSAIGFGIKRGKNSS